jgi:hypothetical protein
MADIIQLADRRKARELERASPWKPIVRTHVAQGYGIDLSVERCVNELTYELDEALAKSTAFNRR